MKNESVITHYGYHRTANRLKVARYLVLAFFLLFAILLFLVFRQDMTLNHLRYLLRNVDLTPSSKLSSGDTVYYDGEADSRFGFVAGGLACLTDTRVFVTDRSSGTTFSDYHGFTSPRAVFSDSYMAVYDRSGSTLYLYNAFARLESFTFDGTVLTASVADDGTLAVAVSEDDGYYTAVYVYNSRFEEVNKLSKYKYVTSLSLSDNGKYLAVGSLFAAKNGYLSSELLYMKVGEKQAIVTHTLDAESLFQVSFAENGRISLLTDRALHIYNEDGVFLKTVAYGDDTPIKSCLGEEGVLLLSSGADGRKDELALYGTDGSLLIKTPLDGVCLDIAEANGVFWLLLDNGSLLAFDKNGALLKEGSVSSSGGSLVSDEKDVYYATSSFATRLSLEEQEEE